MRKSFPSSELRERKSADYYGMKWNMRTNNMPSEQATASKPLFCYDHHPSKSGFLGFSREPDNA